MINHAANEEICSAKYVDSFLDAIENLPDEVQRKITIMRELDIRYQALLNEMDTLRQELEERVNPDSVWVKRLLVHLQDKLIESQDVADEKLAAVQAILDLIEVKQAQLENNAKNLRSDSDNERSSNETSSRHNNNNNEPSERPNKRPRRTPRMDSSSFSYNTTASNIATATASGPTPSSTSSNVTATSTVHLHSHSSGGGAGTQATASSSAGSTAVAMISAGSSSSSSTAAAGGHQQDSPNASAAEKNAALQKTASAKNTAQKKATKKKKRKARAEREREDSPPEMPIDPDEPTYCLCEQVSYGEMIGCDNDLCPIEWFHFSCVNLTHKPKGKWFCPKCRGDKPTIMKPRAQFLRELEKYNKEKEEKS